MHVYTHVCCIHTPYCTYTFFAHPSALNEIAIVDLVGSPPDRSRYSSCCRKTLSSSAQSSTPLDLPVALRSTSVRTSGREALCRVDCISAAAFTGRGTVFRRVPTRQNGIRMRGPGARHAKLIDALSKRQTGAFLAYSPAHPRTRSPPPVKVYLKAVRGEHWCLAQPPHQLCRSFSRSAVSRTPPAMHLQKGPKKRQFAPAEPRSVFGTELLGKHTLCLLQIDAEPLKFRLGVFFGFIPRGRPHVACCRTSSRFSGL